MKPGRGKGKGSAFEREIGRTLSLWMTGGKDKTQLVRSVLSGGWGPRGPRQAGDLAANGHWGEEFRKHFVVECKHRRGELLWGLYTKTGTECILGWWSKLADEARSIGRVPLLIFRQNGRPTMAVVPGAMHDAVAAALYGEEGRTVAPILDCLVYHKNEEAIRITMLPLAELLRLKPATLYTFAERLG